VPLPGAAVGSNPVQGYQLQAVYAWGLDYAPYNFQKADPAHAILSQLYVRQALQYLVNQAEVVEVPLHGYGKISTGPVGDYPPTPFLSSAARHGDPFPYNPYKASKLLTSNGWQLVNGVDECVKPGSLPGDCGSGVTRNQKLQLNFAYAQGIAWVQVDVQQLVSNAAQVGISINTSAYPFNDLLAITSGNCGPTKNQPCPWEIADWGGGWTYAPDYLPTGEELFLTHAVGNFGHYSNVTNDGYIRLTLEENGKAQLNAMYKWEQYLTPKLPVMMQPDAVAALDETINGLHIGVQSPTLQITPETWYYTK